MAPDTIASCANVGIIVIGRNEGERLRAALLSLPGDLPRAYVDSASRDDSVSLARSLSVPVVEIASPPGLSAARARNEGFAALSKAVPALDFVLFLDGDCVLDRAFLPAALDAMAAAPEAAIVVGHVIEADPASNVYGRLAALEWSGGAGEITDFGNLGGIMLVRARDFAAVGGFDPQFIAGEDSELGIRLFLAGHKVVKIDVPMAFHRMEMTRFGQWWRRSIRAGHALSQRYCRHGTSPLGDSRKAFFSTIVYGIAVPVVIAVGLAAGQPLILAVAMVYAAVAWRFFRHYRGKGARLPDAVLGAMFGVIAKFANAAGLVKFFANRAKGAFHMIEYK